jgi:hypothetical protein
MVEVAESPSTLEKCCLFRLSIIKGSVIFASCFALLLGTYENLYVLSARLSLLKDCSEREKHANAVSSVSRALREIGSNQQTHSYDQSGS